jgi:hypothetical protein
MSAVGGFHDRPLVGRDCVFRTFNPPQRTHFPDILLVMRNDVLFFTNEAEPASGSVIKE